MRPRCLPAKAARPRPSIWRCCGINFGRDRSLYVCSSSPTVSNLAHSSLGYSFRNDNPIFGTLILERLGPTSLALMLTAFGTALCRSAHSGSRSPRHGAQYLARSQRHFASSRLVCLCDAGLLAWADVDRGLLDQPRLVADQRLRDIWSAPFTKAGSAAGDIARHLVMPAVALSLFYLAALHPRDARLRCSTRPAMDYVVTARAKGQTERAHRDAAMCCATRCCRC